MSQDIIMGDVRPFNGGIIDTIIELYNRTCYCETELNTKITLNTPGRTYSRLRDFKFNFNYLFSMSSRREEINDKLKGMVRKWLEMEVPYNDDGVIDWRYIKAGIELFIKYGDELSKCGIINYKR